MKSIAELKSTWVFNMKWNQKEKQQILIPNRARRNLKCMFTFHSRPLQNTPIQTQKRRLSAPSPGRFGVYMIYEFKMKRERN